MKHDNGFKYFSLGVVWFWIFLFALLPIGLIFIVSFLSHNENHFAQLPFTLDQYVALNNPIYQRIFQNLFW